MQLILRSMVMFNQPIYPVITKKNVIKYVKSEKDGVTESRLFQIFLGHVHESDLKRRDRYTTRLIRIIKRLKKRGEIYLDENNYRIPSYQ